MKRVRLSLFGEGGERDAAELALCRERNGPEHEETLISLANLAGMRRSRQRGRGVEFDEVSLDLRALLEAHFPGVEIVDCAASAMALRTIKTDRLTK